MHASENLIEAAKSGEKKRVAAALKEGALVDYQDSMGMTALHWAVYGGFFDVVESLVQAGANPDLPSNDGPHATPYWHAKEDFGLTQIADLLEHSRKSHGNRRQRTGGKQNGKVVDSST